MFGWHVTNCQLLKSFMKFQIIHYNLSLQHVKFTFSKFKWLDELSIETFVNEISWMSCNFQWKVQPIIHWKFTNYTAWIFIHGISMNYKGWNKTLNELYFMDDIKSYIWLFFMNFISSQNLVNFHPQVFINESSSIGIHGWS